MARLTVDGVSYVSAEIESCLLNIALDYLTPERVAWAALLALRHMRGHSNVFWHSDYFESGIVHKYPWEYASQCFAIAEHIVEERLGTRLGNSAE